MPGARIGQAKDDAACEAAWAESRRRFFTYPPTASAVDRAGRLHRNPPEQVSAMGGTGVIDNFLGTFTQYIDSGFGLVQGDVRWLAGVLIAIDITLGGSLLGDGARRGRARAADQEDALYRRLRLHHRQLQQPRADHLQLLRGPRHRGGRRHDEPRPSFFSPGKIAAGRHRRRQADPDRDLRHDGLHQRSSRTSSRSSSCWSPG